MNDIHTGSDTLADELLRAYDEGKSIDELNEMLGAGETENEEGLPFAEDEEENKEEKAEAYAPPTEEKKETHSGTAEKPYRTYSTQEAFQKDFDKRFNYRYRKERERSEAKEREFEAFRTQVAEFLGVSPDKALDELEERTIRTRAESSGEDAEALIEKSKTSRELEQLRRELAENRKREAANRAIADIRAQGEELKKSFPDFDLDEAMEEEGFRDTCFSLYNLSPENAVKKAFLACEGLGKFQKKESVREPRVSEGAARPSTSSAVKKVDISGMTDREVLDYERRILNGEKVLLE